MSQQVIKPAFKIKKIEEKADYGKFVLEPLEQGYGQTVGNALRRCLLTSLVGSAVTKVKIDGVRHQFSTLTGLKEDIVALILNLKQIRVNYQGKKEVKAVLEVQGPAKIKAGDIKTPAGVEIVNKDLHLGTLTDSKAKLKAKLWINSGCGYSPAEDRPSTTLGIIPLDAVFSPISSVDYHVEATRVGRRVDFDKLILEIWTDGSIKPRQALESSAEVLTRFFKQIYSPVFEEKKEAKKEEKDSEVLKLTVEELDLPTRIANALRRGGYGTVKDLTKVDWEDIAKVKNLGKKSIDTIIAKLAKKGVVIKS